MVRLCRKAQNERDEFREPLTGHADGDPEPSRGYTLGRCRDYLRTSVFLITGKSVPRPSNDIAGDEIVRAFQKWKEHVNPLVPGSSPGGPTNRAALREAQNARGGSEFATRNHESQRTQLCAKRKTHEATANSQREITRANALSFARSAKRTRRQRIRNAKSREPRHTTLSEASLNSQREITPYHPVNFPM